MNNKNKEDLGTQPRLRFPEFLEASNWQMTSLDKLCSMQAGKFIQASEISEAPNTDLYPCYGGNGLRGYVKTHTHKGKYPLIGRLGAQCGNVTLADGSFYATEHAVVAEPRKEVVTEWLYYLLAQLNLNQYATGQAQPGLSVDLLKRVAAAAPIDWHEQRKIADCLSSLDDLIDAERQKLETLQRHRKGLKQELFPAEGETMPKRRFPEFEGGLEWDQIELGEKTTKVGSGITPTGGERNYRRSGRPFVNSPEICRHLLS